MRPKIPPDLTEQFRRVCPIWAKRIMNGTFSHDALYAPFMTDDGKEWRISRPCSCIAGEAHGRHADTESGPYYGCNECARFSVDLMYVFDSDWTDVLRKFLDHYEKEHALKVTAS